MPNWMAIILALLLSAPSLAAAPELSLAEASFDEKPALITQWLADQPDNARRAIDLMLAGNLYFEKKTQRLVVIDSHRTGEPMTDFATGEVATIERKRNYKRVAVNNDLRTFLKNTLASSHLADPNEQVRLQAVQQMIGQLTAADIELIQAQRDIETDSNVAEWLALAEAIYALDQGDSTALSVLRGSLTVEAMDALRAVPQDSPIYAQAQSVLTQIEQRRNRYAAVETLYFGLSLGSVLVLAGIGLAITFGVMGVINMAHGELIMLGAYTTFVMQQILPTQPGFALILSLPCAFVVSGLVGIGIQRGVIRFLHGRPLETLLATFGVSLILQQAVRSIFSPLNQSVITPTWMSGSWEINAALSLTLNRLFVIGFCLLVFFALLALLKRSSLGLQVRAVSQNRSMARAMGVRSERVDALTFGLGAGVAGLAGVALSQLTNVGPNMGQAYIIDSFMVVVFGGVGNLWGTLVAGLSLGVANKLIEPWAGAVLAKILILVFIVLFIQKNPRGLFPQRGRAAEG